MCVCVIVLFLSFRKDSDDMVAGTSLSSQYPPGFMMTATGTPILEYPPSLAALIGAHESSQAARAFLPRNGGGVEGKAGPVAPTRARKRGSTDGAPFTHPRAQAPPVCSLLPSTSPPQAYGGRSRGEPGPEAGGGVTPIEGMLQKMADACRQAGVVLVRQHYKIETRILKGSAFVGDILCRVCVCEGGGGVVTSGSVW